MTVAEASWHERRQSAWTHPSGWSRRYATGSAIIHKGMLMAIGTLQDLQQHIQNGNADLEQVFFEITQE